MRGVRRLRPVHPIRVPSWDLSVVLEGLIAAPFEPLESAPERILTLKATLLLAHWRELEICRLSLSVKCVWTSPWVWSKWPCGLGLAMFPRFDPHRFALKWSRFTLFILLLLLQVRMRGFTCSVLSELLRYMWTAPNFGGNIPSCFGAGRRGLATSKHIISHWLRDVISLAYEVRGLPSPLSVRAHSTRSVAFSQALFRRVLLEDICVVAGWSSPHIFIRFYNLDLDTALGSQVLSVWTGRVCCLVCKQAR